jgi:hypothetical protein
MLDKFTSHIEESAACRSCENERTIAQSAHRLASGTKQAASKEPGVTRVRPSKTQLSLGFISFC